MSKNILIAEDFALALALAERALRAAGHQVLGATDGWEASNLIGREPFDVAIVDFEMPGPNGLEILDLLRRQQPKCVRLLVSGALTTEVAMQAVNDGGIDYVLNKPYTPQQLVEAVDRAVALRERARISERLPSALEADWFEECLRDDLLDLALQPIVDVDTGRPFGYEALLRSSHPKLATPLQVIGAAERLERLPDVGAFVARAAARWLEILPPEQRVFVNFHPVELEGVEALRRRMVPLEPHRDRVVVEITEQSNVATSPRRQESVRMLEVGGYQVAVDDLGAGYNSLSILAELSPSIVKVDMSMVRNIDRDSRKRRLLRLLCRFSRATGCRLVAEGIETAAERDVVVACGADLLQGYLFAAPSYDRAQVEAWSALEFDVGVAARRRRGFSRSGRSLEARLAAS